MEFLLANNLILLIPALCAIAGGLVGYQIGSRRWRKRKRKLQSEFNQQSLDMLDVKSKHNKLSKSIGQIQRKDRLLRLALKQLAEANSRVQTLQNELDGIEKQHYIKILRLRLAATQAIVKARHARKVAKRIATHAKRLEATLPHTQTISAPPPKSYGQAAAVSVKVVDQHSPDAVQDAIVRVSNRDSAMFSRMRSSNEGQRFNSANLQAIEGIDPTVEKQLNQAGIHRVEQLANMSDSELAALRTVVSAPESDSSNENYTADWKGGAQRLLSRN